MASEEVMSRVIVEKVMVRMFGEKVMGRRAGENLICNVTISHSL